MTDAKFIAVKETSTGKSFFDYHNYYELQLLFRFRVNIHINKTEELKMENLKSKTYRELEQKVIENRKILRTTTNPELKLKLIAENYKLMTEMDSRWNK